jgi:acyl carrier protein
VSENETHVIDVQAIREQVRDFIQTNFLYDGDSSQIDDYSSLLEQGIVDSTGVLELVLFAEETYGLTVDTGDLLPENLDSVDNLANYIARRLAEA